MDRVREGRSARRRPDGMTIVEMMIVAVVFVVLFTLIYQSLVPGLRAWQRSTPRSRAQQSCLVAMGRIVHDLRDSSIAAVFIIPATYTEAESGRTLPCDAVSILCPLGRDGRPARDAAGRAVWQRYSVYYLELSSHTLRCHEEPLPSSGTPGDDIRLKSFTADSARDRIVSRGILSLSVSADRDPGQPEEDLLVNPVTVKIEAGDGEFRTHLRSSVSSLVELVNPGEAVLP